MAQGVLGHPLINQRDKELMEAEYIQWLRDKAPPHEQVVVGIGDDAAIVQCRSDAVVAADMLVEGVHFQLDKVDPHLIGRKALAVNLSDLAAMAARPICAFVSLALPARRAGDLAKSIFEGMMPLATEFDLTVAGGDTNVWNGDLAVNVTVMGDLTEKGPLLRNGARPGDQILVTGDFGGSILGPHYSFQPRIREALYYRRHYRVSAAIDVSDGLSLDLSRMAQASKCGAVLRLSQIPISAAAVELSRQQGDKLSPLEHALQDGEDFELVLAVPSEDASRMLADPRANIPLTCIGQFTQQPGLWIESDSGERSPLEVRGFLHGQAPESESE